MTWPIYSKDCISSVSSLLRKGGSLSAYKGNAKFGIEPSKNSWAWKLEALARKRFSVKHAVAVNSGTAALHVGLEVLGVKNSNVVTSPLSFSATPASVILAGGKPVFADVDHNGLMTEDTIHNLSWHNVRALMPVALFGQWRPFKMGGHRILWDAAQAVGTVSGSKMGQEFMAAVSFNGGKQVPAGECGMLLTNSDDYALNARRLMNHGENFHWGGVGYNYRPNELTACVAWHGLDRVEERLAKRRKFAQILVDGMCDGDVMQDFFTAPDLKKHALYVFNFEVKFGREPFAKSMAKQGINVQEGYIKPTLNKYGAFVNCPGKVPVAEYLSSHSLCLFTHVHSQSSEKEMMRTLKAMKKAVMW
jgi:dTDP-4-amino-4,6-dideoxygalactose transaminase